jgi:hypothetical protein
METGRGARAHPRGAGAVNRAQPALPNDLARSAEGRSETELSSKKINEAALVCFVPQHFHLRRIHRRRLLAKDMLAGFEGGE